jgi:hypothetical protein
VVFDRKYIGADLKHEGNDYYICQRSKAGSLLERNPTQENNQADQEGGPA